MLRVKDGIAILREELKAGRFIMADKAVMRVPQVEYRPSLEAVLRKVREDDKAEMPHVTVWMKDEDGEHILVAEDERVFYTCPRRDVEEILTPKRLQELEFALVDHAKFGDDVYLHYFVGERAVMQAQLVVPHEDIPFWEVLSLNAEPVELLFVQEMLKRLGLDYRVEREEADDEGLEKMKANKVEAKEAEVVEVTEVIETKDK